MRKLVLVVAFLVATSAHAAFVFSDIPWNTPADAVVQKLKAAGFKQVKKDKRSGEVAFHGTLLGHDATGLAGFAQGRLAKVVVLLSTSDEMARAAYSEVRNVLAKKYGPPVRTTVSFGDPFHEGDGYEAEAIRQGKAVYATEWADAGERLVLNIASSVSVAVTYESPDWAGELERRKSKGTSPF
jgi:hypothetical protein